MVEFENMRADNRVSVSDEDGIPATLAMVTMLSKNVYRAVAERDGTSADLKRIVTLSYLRELGALGQKHLGPLLCIDANNVVLLLNQLEADGLVVRRRDPEDRRRHVVELTETGLGVLRHAEQGMFEIEDELLAALDEEQRAQFRALLREALYGENGVFRRATAGTA
jgi:DNA-binding MarR family transcriptional regulator